MLKPVVHVSYGADPEGFVAKDGVIIGSEKVIPRGGLKAGGAIKPHVVLDGVQFELNPPSRNSAPLLGKEISTAFEMLSRQLAKFEGRVTVDWSGLVEVSREELDSLSDACRILGCQPSKNIYEDHAINVDAKSYRKRSAGGHFHFGLPLNSRWMHNRADLVATFDVVVGNTLTMFDRDPGAAERRENYGRAGEYRHPKYGLEYRTPSNFWLRNYTLLSASVGFAQIALAVVNKGYEELFELVDIDHVRKAINTNSFELARDNFEKIIPYLAKYLPKNGFELNPTLLDRVVVFADGVRSKGLAEFFPEDPVKSWVARKQVDFGDFLRKLY